MDSTAYRANEFVHSFLKASASVVCLLAFIIVLPIVSVSAGGSNDAPETNRLQLEPSPYLLQHADNSVDWYPWGEEAFERAIEEDKPIFLSIGYSACHWCHVMERDSFEDDEVASLMNDTFINIIVDREERPDIDSLYMAVAQMMTGSGGWPLTIIMTPDQKPFFAATYIPKQSIGGRPGMLELVSAVAEIWSSRRAEIIASSDAILAEVTRVLSTSSMGEPLDETVFARAFEALSAEYDERLGGFGSATKFPTPHNLMFLLRYWYRSGDPRALLMVENTLINMRRGGVFDHVGYGFHRYSTDPEWRVPHFEKMLYDQALLTIAYTETFQATGKVFYERTAREVIDYVMREMRTEVGGFASAEDADSDGEEGKYYMWRFDELKQILDDDELAELIAHYDIRDGGNFRDEATRQFTGANILYAIRDEPGEVPENDDGLTEDIRLKLMRHRAGRTRPLKDDKILTSWNGMMIAALAKAGGVFDDPDYLDAAVDAADFILANLRTDSGMLLHRYREGKAGIPGYATDYAYFILGLVELYEATFEVKYLREADRLMTVFIRDFWDDDAAGFYLTADEDHELLVRQKDRADGSIPAANSVALIDLVRLGRMTQNTRYDEFASELIRLASPIAQRAPTALTFFLTGVDFHIGPSYEVVISGERNAGDTDRMTDVLRRVFVPNRIILFRPAGDPEPEIAELSPFVRYQDSVDDAATAYVCLDYACELPVTDPMEMISLLRMRSSSEVESGILN